MLDAIDRLVHHFQIPLESAGVDTTEIQNEFEALIGYAAQFMSLSTMDYQSVWWRLFNAPTNSEWRNILTLAKLLFTLPVSNGKFERIFSQLNLIKTCKRATLAKESLQDLLALNSEKLQISEFNPDQAIQLWWEAKQRRPNQCQQKSYKPRGGASSTSSATPETSFAPTTSDTEHDDVEPESFLDDWGDIFSYKNTLQCAIII